MTTQKRLNKKFRVSILFFFWLVLLAFFSTAFGPQQHRVALDPHVFYEKNKLAFHPFSSGDQTSQRAISTLAFLFESSQFRKMAEESPQSLIQWVHIILNSYRLSDPLHHDILTLLSFHLKRNLSHSHRYSFEEISHLNLEVLRHQLESSGSLTQEETSFVEFITQQPFYLMKPSYLDPEKYYQNLLISYDLFAYPALQEYLEALKRKIHQRPQQGPFSQIWISPTRSTGSTLIQELSEYISKISPLPPALLQGLPIKRFGYNASLDAPLLGNGQFVFFRLVPDYHHYTSSNMGSQFLNFTDRYLDQLGVAYLSDHIDPLIASNLEIELSNHQKLSRLTRVSSSEELSELDPEGKLHNLNATTAFYSVCYTPSRSPCVIHNTANEIFFGADIKLAMAWRLIFELRQIKLAQPKSTYSSDILKKRSVDEDLFYFMTHVLHVQALFPGIYPIQSPRYLGVLNSTKN